MRAIVRAGLCLAMLAGAGILGAATATAVAPTLTVTTSFDRSGYVTGDAVTVTMTVRNTGSTDAKHITANDDYSANELVLDSNGFGALANGVTIPAGKSVTQQVVGQLGSLSATSMRFEGYLYDANGFGIVPFHDSAPVTVRTATVRGTVFGDANSNGRADPGEGVSGVKVRLGYRYGNQRYSVTTTGAGAFRLSVPTTSYLLDGVGAGWVVGQQVVDVGAAGSNLTLRAVRPLGKVLKPTMRFTRRTYRVGDTAHIVVTLDNTGSTPLKGISAACDRIGDPDELQNVGPGWGALSASKPGVDLAAGQTRTFYVAAKVPAAAERSGVVAVACDFGYNGVDQGQRPTAGDRARVPGEYGAFSADIDYYPHGHQGAAVGLANVRVAVVDPTTCPVLNRGARTDANGHVRIAHLPAGPFYEVYLYPPAGWKVVGKNPTPAFVYGGGTVRFGVEVVHGSARVPDPPTACANPPAPPVTPPLANTGSDTSGLSIVGGAAVLVGLLFSVSARRRRTR